MHASKSGGRHGRQRRADDRDVWPAVLGTVLIIGGKLWYIDRMAILYADMVRQQPDLRYGPRRPDAPSQTAPVTTQS